MSSTSSVPASAVPMGQKIAFGFGMLANQMFPAALGVFIIVLVQDLGFAALLWGTIQFLPRIFDAITDPVMGFISDNTRSKWGRRRQYVFIGAILMVFCVLPWVPLLGRAMVVLPGRPSWPSTHYLLFAICAIC